MSSEEFVSRRKHPRHNIGDYISVADAASGQNLGRVANLSLEGLMLVNSQPLNADCIYQLKLVIDGSQIPGAGFDLREIMIGVDCLWASPAKSTSASAYWSGCQIIDVSESDFEAIKLLINTIAE